MDLITRQLTLIQGGEFIVCEDIAYVGSPPSLSASTALPINTMRGVAVRLGDEIVPLPFIRSQDRRAVSDRIRIEGNIATRIARDIGLDTAVSSPKTSTQLRTK
jgi:hypothetical protein